MDLKMDNPGLLQDVEVTPIAGSKLKSTDLPPEKSMRRGKHRGMSGWTVIT